MGAWPKGGSDSGVRGFVRDRCDIRPSRRSAEALGGCTGIVGKGVEEIGEGGKISAGFSHDGWGSFVAGNRGGVWGVVRWFGGSLTALRMDSERVQAFFGDKPQFPEIDKSRDVVSVGLPVDACPGGGTYTGTRIHKPFKRAEI